jgi:hypothetical protein
VPRSPKPKPAAGDVARAAKLSRVPGVTIAEAAARFAVAPSAVARARKTTPALSLAELALAAITDNGTRSSGTLSAAGLTRVAGWIDYINHDGCRAEDVRELLAECVKQGAVAIQGEKWKLVAPWP